jgi:hypothetical protein
MQGITRYTCINSNCIDGEWDECSDLVYETNKKGGLIFMYNVGKVAEYRN